MKPHCEISMELVEWGSDPVNENVCEQLPWVWVCAFATQIRNVETVVATANCSKK